MQIERVQKLNQSELDRIIDIHFTTLKESTLNLFGRKFLQLVYKTALKNDIVIVLKENEEIHGYCIATVNIDYFYKNIIQSHFLELSIEVLKKCLTNPLLLIRVVTWTLFHKSKKDYPAELQFIAIDPKYQGRGFGGKILSELSKEFRKLGVNHFKVGTWKSNPNSNAFYQKMGFKLIYTEKVLGADFNFYLSPEPK